MSDKQADPGFPSWRFGPNEAKQIFEFEADVPSGWEDHPSKVRTKERVKVASEDGLPSNVPKLKSIARAEGVDLTGATKAADIKARIQAHRLHSASLGAS